MTLVDLLNNIHAARQYAEDAKSLLEKISEAGGSDLLTPAQLEKANESITAFMRFTAEAASIVSRRNDELQRKWDSVPVLEAVIQSGDQSRKIVVAKPTERITSPFIVESYYNAIRGKWNGADDITTTEDYDILVINRKGRIIKTIAHK